jgi:formyltetrahydrofolate deformylase
MSSVTALIYGADKPGIVAKVSGWIHEQGSNVLHADQHLDRQENVFFQRVEWECATGSNPLFEGASFQKMVELELDMKVKIGFQNDSPKVGVMVSKADHCFHDLALRFRSSEWSGEIAGVISNHDSLRGTSMSYDLPFHFFPITEGSKADAEAKQLAWIKNEKIDLLILARYMQILSADFLDKVCCPVINIHHSFLPSFAGASPYHQAYARGVKLIGATAHYVTKDLDEGPIIGQDVTRVSHRHGPKDLIEKGRDLEKLVLSTAVRRHLQNRVLIYQNKTVVFD